MAECPREPQFEDVKAAEVLQGLRNDNRESLNIASSETDHGLKSNHKSFTTPEEEVFAPQRQVLKLRAQNENMTICQSPTEDTEANQIEREELHKAVEKLMKDAFPPRVLPSAKRGVDAGSGSESDENIRNDVDDGPPQGLQLLFSSPEEQVSALQSQVHRLRAENDKITICYKKLIEDLNATSKEREDILLEALVLSRSGKPHATDLFRESQPVKLGLEVGSGSKSEGKIENEVHDWKTQIRQSFTAPVEQVSAVQDEVSALQGQLSALQGQVSALRRQESDLRYDNELMTIRHNLIERLNTRAKDQEELQEAIARTGEESAATDDPSRDNLQPAKLGVEAGSGSELETKIGNEEHDRRIQNVELFTLSEEPVSTAQDDVWALQGQVSALQSQVSALQSQVRDLRYENEFMTIRQNLIESLSARSKDEEELHQAIARTREESERIDPPRDLQPVKVGVEAGSGSKSEGKIGNEVHDRRTESRQLFTAAEEQVLAVQDQVTSDLEGQVLALQRQESDLRYENELTTIRNKLMEAVNAQSKDQEELFEAIARTREESAAINPSRDLQPVKLEGEAGSGSKSQGKIGNKEKQSQLSSFIKSPP